MADLRLKPVRIHFDQPWRVYEMRRGFYRGHTDVVKDLIYPAQAELYALLPYEVRDLDIDAQWDSAAIMIARSLSGTLLCWLQRTSARLEYYGT